MRGYRSISTSKWVQMQFVDNRALGHSRTAFDDYPDPEQKRHLVRLWLRDMDGAPIRDNYQAALARAAGDILRALHLD